MFRIFVDSYDSMCNIQRHAATTARVAGCHRVSQVCHRVAGVQGCRRGATQIIHFLTPFCRRTRFREVFAPLPRLHYRKMNMSCDSDHSLSHSHSSAHAIPRSFYLAQASARCRPKVQNNLHTSIQTALRVHLVCPPNMKCDAQNFYPVFCPRHNCPRFFRPVPNSCRQKVNMSRGGVHLHRGSRHHVFKLVLMYSSSPKFFRFVMFDPGRPPPPVDAGWRSVSSFGFSKRYVPVSFMR